LANDSTSTKKALLTAVGIDSLLQTLLANVRIETVLENRTDSPLFLPPIHSSIYYTPTLLLSSIYPYTLYTHTIHTYTERHTHRDEQWIITVEGVEGHLHVRYKEVTEPVEAEGDQDAMGVEESWGDREGREIMEGFERSVGWVSQGRVWIDYRLASHRHSMNAHRRSIATWTPIDEHPHPMQPDDPFLLLSCADLPDWWIMCIL
jgi:hypothetical protein